MCRLFSCQALSAHSQPEQVSTYFLLEQIPAELRKKEQIPVWGAGGGKGRGKQWRYCFSTLSVVCQGPTQVINSSVQKRLILCSWGQTWVGRSATTVGLCMIEMTSCADVNLIPVPAMVMNLPLDVSADSFWFQFEVTQNNWEFTPCFTCYQCLFFSLLWKSGF